MSAGDSRPIGVFDSGIGGLTVVRALMERLPLESIVYFGDTARVPYGVKSVATIRQFTAQIVDYLLRQEVKMLIVACNTMAAVASRVVATRAHGLPTVDVIEAGSRAAVAVGKGGRIGVIGTPTTINSNAYARRIAGLDSSARVYSQACPLFVPLVEEGWLDHPVTKLTAREYLRPVLAEDIGSLVLGCTHYPLLKPLLREVVGEKVQLIDSALTAAELAALRLSEAELAADGAEPAAYRYVVTDVPLRFQTIGERFLGRSLGEIERVDW